MVRTLSGKFQVGRTIRCSINQPPSTYFSCPSSTNSKTRLIRESIDHLRTAAAIHLVLLLMGWQVSNSDSRQFLFESNHLHTNGRHLELIFYSFPCFVGEFFDCLVLFSVFSLLAPLSQTPTWTLVREPWSACFPRHHPKPEVDGRGFRGISIVAKVRHYTGENIETLLNAIRLSIHYRKMTEGPNKAGFMGEDQDIILRYRGDFNFNGGGGRLKRTPVRPLVLLWHIKVLQSRLYHSFFIPGDEEKKNGLLFASNRRFVVCATTL